MFIKSTSKSLQTSLDGNVWDGVYQLSDISDILGTFNVSNINNSNPSMPANRQNYAVIKLTLNSGKTVVFDLNFKIVNVTTSTTYTASQSSYNTFLAWLVGLIA